MQNAAPNGDGAVLLGGERDCPTENTLNLQPSTLCELRALRLIASHNVRPELALALAALAYGGAA